MNRTGYKIWMGASLVVMLIMSCSIVFSQSTIAQEDDFTIPQSKQQDELVNRMCALFEDKNWDELEKIAEELRIKKLRFPSGRWKLEAFYKGLSNPEKVVGSHDWNSLITGLQEWKAAKPASITPVILLGEAYISYGWEARGSGYANTVTKDGLRLFKDRIAKARQYLEAAEKMPTNDPETYCALLTIARAQGWSRSDCEALFREAIQIEPNYHNTYFTMAAYLLPRWYGKSGDVERFAEQSIELCPEEGNAIYARIAWNLAYYVRINRFFDEYSFSWPRMRQGFQELQKLYPKSLRNLTAFCLFACIAQDCDTARELFGQMKGKCDKDVWINQDYYRKCKEWAERK